MSEQVNLAAVDSSLFSLPVSLTLYIIMDVVIGKKILISASKSKK